MALATTASERLWDWRLLKLRSAGMFSNVNEVVEQLRRAEAGGYRFVIDWQSSPYLDPGIPGDPWCYYFHPCFAKGADKPTDPGMNPASLPVLPGGALVACARDNIITPRKTDGVCAPLLLPMDRTGAHTLIMEYLTLKDSVGHLIDSFAARHFVGFVIGLHIRGPGRRDGGVCALRSAYGPDNEVPFTPFFAAVDRVIANEPDSRIFAASDSSAVMSAIVDRYGTRVISWPAQRSNFGEMHADHPKNRGITFSKYALGLDVICEAYLLARTAHVIHGNSNIANFVLCLNPYLGHDYIPA